ncbi:DMT family transporter [bacterium]|nr:DMT family transporter [candidate division CSSED10-310 bacterium]
MRAENKGLLLMVTAALVFSGMNVLVKIALREYSYMETVFFRSAFGTIIMFTFLRLRHLPVIGRRPGMLFLRGFLGFLGLSCYYFAMARLTLADTVILNKISPLFVMILAHFLLKEVLSRAHLAILFSAIFGIYNIVQPQLEIAPLAGLIGLASAVFSAAAYIVVKKLSADHSSAQIVFAFVAVATFLSIPVMMPSFVCPRGADWLIFLGIGATSSAAQLIMTKAYALGAPTPVSIASYGVVIFSALWGFLFFNEIQDTQALTGTILVIGCLLVLPFINAGRTRRTGSFSEV